MGPHSNNFDHLFVFENLIYETMLNINSPRDSSGQIALLQQARAQVIVRLRKVGLDPNRCPILSNGFVQFSLGGERGSQIVVSQVIAPGDRYGPPEKRLAVIPETDLMAGQCHA